jgi:predicted 3-demethylubiquinone-9 3-methyltransferase (glyoxalase superfamily)
MKKIGTFLVLNGQAKEAAQFYTSLFKDSKIRNVVQSGDSSVMVVEFDIEGQQFFALNAGPDYKFSEAISIYVSCDTQAEIDALWRKLTAGGEESICGWLKDRYGVSWQVAPTILPGLLTDPDPEKAGRVMAAMTDMRKLDIKTLKAAHAGV